MEDASRPVTEPVRNEKDAKNTDPNLITLFLWKHVVPGWDVKTKQTTFVTFHDRLHA